MTDRQLQAFTVACIIVSAFVGWSLGQLIVHVMSILAGE